MTDLSVWYVSNLQRCNYTCSYCASGQPVLQKRPGSLPTWAYGEDVHDRVVDWLIRQPHNIRLRMNSIGEPFISTSYLDSVARLTQSDNISFVEILTNGSFRPSQFDRFAEKCKLSKLSLWMTFHHEFSTPDEIIEAAAYAQDRGAFVVLHTIAFPDNLDAVDRVITLAEARGLKITTGMGIDFNEAYNSAHVAPVLDQPNPRALRLANYNDPLGDLHQLSATPRGQACGAGHRYFFISAKGDVYPCLTYYNSRLSERRLGSVLDADFTFTPRAAPYAPCVAPTRCTCPEDYQNLKAIHERFTWPYPSFCLPVADASNDRCSA